MFPVNLCLISLILAGAFAAGQHKPSLSEDESHIKEHLQGTMDVDTTKMTPEELEFHYFKLHDYDGNNQLDGLEMLKALVHHPYGPNSGDVDITPFETLIDQILKDDDIDQDGYLSYEEFKKRNNL